MKREEMIRSLFLVAVLLIPSALVLNPVEESEGKMPTRAEKLVYFTGSVMNLTAENISMFGVDWMHLGELFPDNDTLIVQNTDFAGGNPTTITRNATWFNPNLIWNTSTYSFEIEFDIDPVAYSFNLDSIPWTFKLKDRYGFNTSYGGRQDLLNFPLFENFSSTSSVELENNSLAYEPGVFGDMSFTILNGSSMEPLEEVGFSFTNHPYHSSVMPNETHNGVNVTDENGNITFTNLQLGLETGLNKNRLEIYILKEHFNTQDGSGIIRPILFEGNETHYTFILPENKRVKTIIPQDGATDVTANKIRAQIQVEFFDPMDVSSVTMQTLYLENQTAKVPVDYQWDVESKLLTMRPQKDLDYDTEHYLTITSRVKDAVGGYPIWRNDVVSFTTELHPGWIEGTVLVQGTTDPAPAGSEIFVDGTPTILENGYFKVTGLGTGLHTVQTRGPTVNNVYEYLYYGMNPFDVDITKGDEITLDNLYVTKREVIDLEIAIEDPGSTRGPVEGVFIKHRITQEEQVTDTEGKAVFNDILVNYTTIFDAFKENYIDKLILHMVPGGQVAPMNITVEMIQEELPVEASYWTGDKNLLKDGSIVDVDAWFRFDFTENMDIETMNTDNIRLRQIGGDLIPISVKNDTMNYRRWIIRPREKLPYDGNFEMIINDTIADEMGMNPFWKNYRVSFKTPSLSPAAVEGIVSVNGRGIEGIDISVIFEGDVLASGVSGDNGAYLFEVPLTRPEMTPVKVVADGSAYGLSNNEVPFLTLRSGTADPVGIPEMNLTRLPDWFSYEFDKDYQGNMLVDGSISLSFKHPLGGVNLDSFTGNFTLKISSTPEDLDIMVSEDKRNVTIDPSGDLEYETTYVLFISYFEFDLGSELKLEDGTPALIRGEKISLTTSLKPIKLRVMDPVNTEDVDLTRKINIYFENHTVDRAHIEEALELVEIESDEPVKDLEFTWKTEGKNLEIGHETFDNGVTYALRLAAGSYGVNDARLFDDFEFVFTTIYRGKVYVGLKIPESLEPESWSTTITNPRGKPIQVIIGLRIKGSTEDYTELVNIIIPGFGDATIELDLTDYEEETYEVYVQIFDEGTDNLMDEQYYYLNVEKAQTTKEDGLPIWAIIIFVVIILIVIGLAGYLYVSGKKKGDIEETHEEFECPECHNIVSDNDTVCPHCGAEFEEEAYKCPKCSAMLDPEDETCSECGYDFSDQDQMELEDDDEEEIEEGDLEEDEFEEEEEEEEEDLEEEMEEEMEEDGS